MSALAQESLKTMTRSSLGRAAAQMPEVGLGSVVVSGAAQVTPSSEVERYMQSAQRLRKKAT